MAGPPTGIDTTPVTAAVIGLSSDLMMAGDAAAAFAQLMFYAQNTLMMREQELQMSIMTPERRRGVETVFQRPWSEIYEEEFGDVSGKAMAMEGIQAGIRDEYGITPTITANINLTSNLYLNQTLLAQALQQVLGANLSNATRGYGTRGGGGAPPVMI